MARGLNKVLLIGNLGADPDVRYTGTNAAVANITIATTSAYKDKKTENVIKTTEWHRVVFFGRLAEIMRDYVHKGSKIYVEGALRTRKWADKQGIDRYTTEIVAHEMQMLDGNRAGAGQPQQQEEEGSYKDAAQAGGGAQFDDDIPF